MIKNNKLFYREKATKALWFAETYGLVLKELKMEDTLGNFINVLINLPVINRITFMIKNNILFCREKATKALWFAETYGLVLKELKMEDRPDNDINVTLTGTIIQGTCNKIHFSSNFIKTS